MPERKKGVVPRLRFPEFRNAGQWEVKWLGKVYRFTPTNSLSRDKLNYAHGRVKNIHYGDIHTKFRPLFDINNEDVPYVNDGTRPEQFDEDAFCMNGDVIFADASEDLDDIGKAIEIVNTDGQKLISGLHTLHARPIGLEFAPGFSGYLFQIRGIRKQIQREAQGAKVLGISAKRLATIKIYFPGKKEQQKIANCLSSLDEVIELEVQKLEALKAHKKGLMQQLFPREGETTPRLRFPEFRDAGPWEVKRLSNTLHRISNGLTIAQVSGSCGVKVTRIETISTGRIDPNKVGYVNTDQDITQYRLRIGDILFSHINSLTHIGKSAYVDKDYNLYHGMNLLRLSVDAESNDSRFVFYLINTSIFQFSVRARANQAINQASINQTELGQSCVLIPTKKEQQKIADCLTSLDEVIELQAKELDALKTHKKGLMQQLFPQEVD